MKNVPGWKVGRSRRSCRQLTPVRAASMRRATGLD